MYSFKLVTNATKLSNLNKSQDWNDIMEEEERERMEMETDMESVRISEDLEPAKLSEISDRFKVGLYEPEISCSEDIAPFFNLTDNSNFAFASLVLRYNGAEKVEAIKQSVQSFLINMTDIFEFEVRFRNDVFNRTCLPLGIAVNMSDACKERFKDSCRVLNCVLSGSSLSSFERRVVPIGEGNLEGLNDFLNDNSWMGKTALHWSGYLKPKLQESGRGTLGQWIYYKLYIRFCRSIGKRETRDCNLRVLIAFICKLRRCEETEVCHVVNMFEDFLDKESCSDCYLKKLGYKKFPYAWNECDSFSFLIGGANLNESVFIDYGLECFVTENRITRLGSKMGIRYFGEHSTMYSSFVGSKTTIASRNPSEKFGALEIRVNDWHSVAMTLEIVTSVFKFAEKRKLFVGMRIYMEENKLTYLTDYNDIFDIFIPLVRRLSIENKEHRHFYLSICFVLMTGKVMLSLWKEYEKFRKSNNMHKSMVFALRSFKPTVAEEAFLCEIASMSDKREVWKCFMDEMYNIDIPFEIEKDITFKWVNDLTYLSKDLSVGNKGECILDLFDSELIHSAERSEDYVDLLTERIRMKNSRERRSREDERCMKNSNNDDYRILRNAKPVVFKTIRRGESSRKRLMPHSSTYLRRA